MGRKGQDDFRSGDEALFTPSVWRLLAVGTAVVAVLLRALAFSPLDQHHADELTQYFEQAHRIVTGSGIVPWEARFGIRNSLIPQLLAMPIALGRWLAPGTMAPLYLARGIYAALTLLALPAAWQLGALTSRAHAWIAMLVVAVWWQSILFSDLLLSESLAAAILLLAAAPLLDEGATHRRIAASACLLGLGVLLRFQFAPFAAVLAIHTLRLEPRRWRPLLAGGLAAAAAGAASDLLAGTLPFAWIFANFAHNIGEGRAARFGTSGPFEYLVEYYRHFGAAALLFTVLAIVPAARRYAPLLFAAAATILAHSLLAHKEYRFVWVATQSVMIVASVGSLSLVQRAFRQGAARSPFQPLLATASIWCLLSFASASATGGYRSLRGGGGLSELAITAAKRPEVCRLAVAQAYYLYAAPSILPRPLPLSVVPEGVLEGRVPLPASISRSSNALLMGHSLPKGADGYRRVACTVLPEEKPCLYVRPGTCTADPVYDVQAALERAGL
ncbi:Alg9-like mannosyltransferase family protein [Novosphingobium panipatense]|uniref:Alg9-like mannosyltransferase family protein n=2 Tax=Novosphingobium panipatense TaxID=428991 RepID=A0ABY1Q8F8_9SPHN|nr:Alg9-like mannosyltransferase family protein [Novosphingobium panipatense]